MGFQAVNPTFTQARNLGCTQALKRERQHCGSSLPMKVFVGWPMHFPVQEADYCESYPWAPISLFILHCTEASGSVHKLPSQVWKEMFGPPAIHIVPFEDLRFLTWLVRSADRT